MLDKEMLKVGDVEYKLDESKINIGYFGRFYPNRSVDDMLALLKNENANELRKKVKTWAKSKSIASFKR